MDIIPQAFSSNSEHHINLQTRKVIPISPIPFPIRHVVGVSMCNNEKDNIWEFCWCVCNYK